ncbi:hypothetical protein [Roseomonas genomospecies 6]|uniref:Uncharacterized protein n=1 Tax=Roseomonas genomospecies 6 TaxID=214106 RepID=A0A9W7KRB4_9PROT|nr:hypothetical protein [Roseomonas genomospecies 6]KAA0678255.1 hypothetical protein DS843_20595 [Roseomonas genomospecies 6]
MISGASYNVFNGEEHLLHSLRVMRRNVDYINIVVQFTSNLGLPASPALNEALHAVISEKLVDEIHFYEPDLSIEPARNEIRKRSIGLDMAKRAAVSHFMTMDCDEYYPPSEFKAAKDFIVAEGVEATAVRTYLHIKRPIWRSKEPDVTCCSFLTRIGSDSQLTLGAPYPALVDPTRRLFDGRQSFHMFDTAAITMRHMNLVRTDLSSKLANSSNAHMVDFMRQVRAQYDAWTFGQDLLFPNKPPMEIVEVEDLFGIDRFFPQ